MISAIDKVVASVKAQPEVSQEQSPNLPQLLESIEEVVALQQEFKAHSPIQPQDNPKVLTAIITLADLIQTSFPSPQKTTFLKAINRSRDENLHSDYLASLIPLHPQITALWGLKGLLLSVARETRLDYLQPSLKGSNLGSRRIDLLIETTDSILILENKVDSEERTDQTEDYYRVLKSNTQKEIKGILLSPQGLQASCPHFKKITYYHLFTTLSQLSPRSEILDYYLSELFDIFIKPYNKEQNHE